MGKLVAHAKLISALTATRMTPTVATRYKDAHAPTGEASSWFTRHAPAVYLNQKIQYKPAQQGLAHPMVLTRSTWDPEQRQ